MLALVLGACVFFALFGRRMPAPLTADAPLERFAAERARAHLDVIARAPRPASAPEEREHEAARHYLAGELRALGLEPEVQASELLGLPLFNLVACIPGSAPSGAVLLLAHYDSVAGGPGAADDGAGVVVWLEALRALGARGWRPRNDVLLLLSDGEELDLLGAKLFSHAHPAAADVRAVVNLEAIGNGGPAVLFQTGPENGGLVRAFARAVEAPCGTSLGDAVYRRMPNDTDLTVFLERGVGGYNLALVAGSAAYHAPHDTSANLDPRSLQHMGECALALAESLGDADLNALAEPDATFFDVLGVGLVRYPRAWDPLIVALGLGLVGAALAVHRPRPRALLREVALLPLESALTASVLLAAWFLCDRAVQLVAADVTWVGGNTTTGTLNLLGLVCLVAVLAGRRGARAPERVVERALAAQLWFVLGALAALVFLPGASFAPGVMLLLAAPGVLAAGRGELAHAPELAAQRAPFALSVQAITLALATLFGLPILHLLLQLFQRTPERSIFLVATVLALASGLFLPQLAVLTRDGWTRRAFLVTGVASLAGSIVVAHVLVWRQGSFLP